MHLRDYLREKDISQSEFALKYDPPVSAGLVSQWINGTTRMTLDKAIQTEKITFGMVAPKDCADMFKEAA